MLFFFSPLPLTPLEVVPLCTSIPHTYTHPYILRCEGTSPQHAHGASVHLSSETSDRYTEEPRRAQTPVSLELWDGCQLVTRMGQNYLPNTVQPDRELVWLMSFHIKRSSAAMPGSRAITWKKFLCSKIQIWYLFSMSSKLWDLTYWLRAPADRAIVAVLYSHCLTQVYDTTVR